MKSKMLKTGIALYIFSLTLLVLAGCKQHSSESRSSAVPLQQLKSDLKDVGQDVDRLAAAGNDTLVLAGREVLDKFNTDVDDFETKLDASGEEISLESRAMIDELKTKANLLAYRLDSTSGKTAEDWQNYNREIRSDFAAFGRSLKSFFSSDQENSG